MNSFPIVVDYFVEFVEALLIYKHALSRCHAATACQTVVERDFGLLQLRFAAVLVHLLIVAACGVNFNFAQLFARRSLLNIHWLNAFLNIMTIH